MASTEEKGDVGRLKRTSVALDDALVREAMEITGARTKRGLLEEALRVLVRLRRQERIWNLFGRIDWEGDLDEMRKGPLADGDC